jgi:hypothetical protein
MDNAQQPQSHKLSLLDFADWTSAVIDEVAALLGTDVTPNDGYTLWPFRSVQMFLEPLRTDIADRKADDYWVCGYALRDSN